MKLVFVVVCAAFAATFGTVHAATVLITGADRGLGLEFTRQYAARGDTVIATCRPSITYIRNDRSGAATNTLSYHALTVPS